MASARAENEFKLLKVASTMKNITSVTPKAHDNGVALNFTARLPQPSTNFKVCILNRHSILNTHLLLL